jgi:hypothetical protein
MDVRSAAAPAVLTGTAEALAAAFPHLPVVLDRTACHPTGVWRPSPGLVVVPTSYWQSPAFDPFVLDDAVARAVAEAGHFMLRLDDDARVNDLAAAAVQVVTRCQRHLDGRNESSDTALFDAILVRHRDLHDLDKPLVAADHAHARDTWRWVLRLEPAAGVAVQVAALFHDIERLISESERRVEQHAPDYRAFKEAHAVTGARLASACVLAAGGGAALADRVAELVASHEHPEADPDKALLNEADALSFFSLNAPGFARYYGPTHTARKVAYTLARLGPRGRRELARVRHRADIAGLIEQMAEGRGSAA